MTTFTPAQEAEIFAQAKAAAAFAAAEEARKRTRERGEWMSQMEVCGMLDIRSNTLERLPIKRYVLIPKTLIRYQLSEVLDFLKSVRE